MSLRILLLLLAGTGLFGLAAGCSKHVSAARPRGPVSFHVTDAVSGEAVDGVRESIHRSTDGRPGDLVTLLRTNAAGEAASEAASGEMSASATTKSCVSGL